MENIRLEAHAKVNLILNIVGKREDGYHELRSIMQAIPLCDIVEIGWERNPGLMDICACGGGFEISLDPGNKKLPSGPKNLAYKAAFEMHRAFHIDYREAINIKITKNIPLAAGMAGGSADGAAVIYGLAMLWGLWEDIDARKKCFEIAASLGSDLPFCLMTQTGQLACLCEGRGEILTPVEALECRIETLTPKIEVPTPKVYGELKPSDYEKQFDVDAYIAAEGFDEKIKYLGNHLQAPALRLFPKIGAALNKMSEDPDALVTMQSGSGPTVFSIYKQ